MHISEFGIRQRVLVKLVLILIIALGSYIYFTLPRALDPDVSFQVALIRTVCKGLSPQEVEELVTVPIEDEIKDLTKIEKFRSFSQENLSTIVVEFAAEEEDLDKLVQELQNEVNKVADLPPEAEKPDVKGLEVAAYPVAIVALASDLDEDRLKDIAEDLAEEFETIKDVAKADIRGDREREVWVEADPRRLKAYGLSLGELISLLGHRNRNVTGGDVELGREEVTVRSLGKFERVEDMGGMVLKRNGRGGVVYLRDVARVRMTHEDPKLKVTLDGKPAFFIEVLRKKKGNDIRIIEGVKERLREFEARFGGRIRSSIVFDTSLEIKKRIFTLQRNALIGMGLVLLVLYIFLGLRNAIFAFIGIPITLLITFIFFWWLGITVNGISLFAVILMLGIIVDDAIIVLENAVRHAEGGIPPGRAALQGAKEVTLPVMASMLTTAAAFAPLFLVVGIMGRFIEQIPTVVIIILAASLFECFFMLPSHFAEHGRPDKEKRERPFFLPYLKRLHRRVLKAALRHRGLTVLIAVLSLVGALALVPKVEMFPNMDAFPRFDVKVWMPAGTSIEETHRVLQQVRELAMKLPHGEVESTVTYAGLLLENYAESQGDHLGMATVLLKERGKRRLETVELIDRLRPMVLREVVGARTIKFERILEGPPEGAPVEIAVKGKDYTILKAIAGRLKEEFRKIPGVVDIDDDYRPGKRELRVRVDEAKSRLWGITAGEVADTIRAAFEGTEATKFHEQDEEIDVLVKLLPEYRRSLDDIGSLTLIGEGGRAIPLKEVAGFELVRGIDRIRRVDGKRAVRVTGELTGGATSKAVNDRIRRRAPLLLAGYPGYTLSFGGEYEKTQEALYSVYKAFALAIFLIYFILGSQFRSFSQPLIIMLTIPFASVGVMMGLFVRGDNFSFATMIGLVALAGVVVNDSLVLVDFVNRYRRENPNILRAILKATSVRLRPILLTSITTIFGLLPMALEIGAKSVLWGPLANAMIWGLIFSTALTLVIIPVAYMIIEDVKRFGRSLTGREPKAPSSRRKPATREKERVFAPNPTPRSLKVPPLDL